MLAADFQKPARSFGIACSHKKKSPPSHTGDEEHEIEHGKVGGGLPKISFSVINFFQGLKLT